MELHDRASPREILAWNVRRIRLERGMSQHDLAAEAKTRQALVSAIEVGDANPTLDTLTRLAQALDVDLHVLLRKASAK